MASLEDRIIGFIDALALDIKRLFSRSMPAGGGINQALVKLSQSDYAATWQNPPPARLQNWLINQIDFVNASYNGTGVAARTENNLEAGYSISFAGTGTTYGSVIGAVRFNFRTDVNSTDRYCGIYHNFGNLTTQVNLVLFNGGANVRRIDYRAAFVLFGRANHECITRAGFVNAAGQADGNVRGLWFEWNPNNSTVSLKYTKKSDTAVTVIATNVNALPTINTGYTVQFVDDYAGGMDCYLNDVLITKLPFSEQPAVARYANCIEVVRFTGTGDLVSIVQLDYLDTVWNLRIPR